MQLANPSKALILLCSLISVTFLMAIGKITTEVATPILTGITFYGIGNGVGAARGQQAPKIFETKEPTE